MSMVPEFRISSCLPRACPGTIFVSFAGRSERILWRRRSCRDLAARNPVSNVGIAVEKQVAHRNHVGILKNDLDVRSYAREQRVEREGFRHFACNL